MADYYAKHEYYTKFRAKCATKRLIRMTHAVRRGSAVLVLVTPEITNDVSNVMSHYKGYPEAPTQGDKEYARIDRSNSNWRFEP